ncbi:MAG: CPBP family intramembrane metalloprotease [Lentisphaerales bacterium]|nr:CPBP family intramembrane metalloprotease [Lentisphaerales bacterium]
MFNNFTDQQDAGTSRYFFPLLSFGFIVLYFAGMSKCTRFLLPEGAQTLTDFAIFGGVALNAILFSIIYGVFLTKMPFRWSEKQPLKYKFVAVIYGWLTSIAVSMLFALVFYLVGYKPELQEVAKKIANISSEYIYLVLLGPALFVPLVEEIVFRGFLYRSIVAFAEPDELNTQIASDRKKLWTIKVIAMITSSVIFALAHMEVHVMPQLFLLGMIFNYAYEKTGSISVATTLHILNNFIGIAGLLINGEPLAS